ncbi:hypothetical protein [Streptomyces sp. NPDC059129]|uniref:hypothetical protein n=1 Tax=unclassified Streptomyces TaxID=2593676 RepID=UPI003680A2FE
MDRGLSGGRREEVFAAPVLVAHGRRAVSKARELWPYPDLAVVRLLDAPSDHPCAWVDTVPPSRDAGLTAIGFSDVYEPGSASEHSAALVRGGTTKLQGGSMLELVGDEVNKGLSGGPVLNHECGGVCAIVKATRLRNTSMGGLGTPRERPEAAGRGLLPQSHPGTRRLSRAGRPMVSAVRPRRRA